MRNFFDPTHLLKNLRGSLANWWIGWNGALICLSILVCLRFHGQYVGAMAGAISIAALQYRDRMDTDLAVQVCRPAVIEILRQAKGVVVSLCPEKLRPWDVKSGVAHNKLPANTSKDPAAGPSQCVFDLQGRLYVASKSQIDIIVLSNPVRLVPFINARSDLQDKVDTISGLCLLKDRWLILGDSEAEGGGELVCFDLDKMPNSTSGTSLSKLAQPKFPCHRLTFDFTGVPEPPARARHPQAMCARGTTSDVFFLIYKLNPVVYVMRLDPALHTATAIASYAPDIGNPQCIAWHVDGCLAVTDAGDDRHAPAVYLIDTESDDGDMECIATFKPAYAPFGVAFTPSRLLVSDRKQHVIWESTLAPESKEWSDLSILTGKLGVGESALGDFASARFRGPCGLAAFGESVAVCNPAEPSVKLLCPTGPLVDFLTLLGQLVSIFCIVPAGDKHDKEARAAAAPGSIADCIVELKAVVEQLEKHITDRQAVSKPRSAQVEGPDGAVCSGTVARLRLSLDSLQQVADELKAAGLQFVLDSLDIRSISTMPCERFFSFERTGRDEHPDLVAYLRRLSVFLKEYVKSVSVTGFNVVWSRLEYYVHEPCTVVPYAVIEKTWSSRLDNHNILEFKELEARDPAGAAALLHLQRTLKAQKSKKPRANSKQPCGVDPVPAYQAANKAASEEEEKKDESFVYDDEELE